jgi:signal transduction histidine kinase
MTTAVQQEVADAAAYARVQAANQQQIIGKLLHDLRNPVHSLRIAVELFNRLAQPQADAAALLPRVGRYAPGAQTAIEALSQQTERLGVYLHPPRRPALQLLVVNDCLKEIVTLLRDAAEPVEIDVRSRLADDVGVLADRPRLGHALLAWMRQSANRTLAANANEDGVWIAAGPGESAPADPDVRALLESAGGRLTDARVLFRRA